MLDLSSLAHPPQRVVSLVPSTTASLFELGFGQAVVGVTDYCSLPIEETSLLPKVGGPKNARLDAIASLSPDLVIANQEENSRDLIEGLVAAGIPTWLTFPKTVRDSMDDLWALARVFHHKNAALQLRLLEDSLKLAELGMADQPRKRFFCPIWQNCEADGTVWWMTFNQETYSGDLLRILGGENVFADRLRRYPLSANWGQTEPEEAGDRDVRYPVVSASDVRAAMPEMILLPDEPFDFRRDHLQAIQALFPDIPAVRNHQILLVDGKMITWHGTYLGNALASLPQYFS